MGAGAGVERALAPLGAAVGYLARVPRRVTASVMAFGSGVLLPAVSFELFAEACPCGCGLGG